MKKKHGWLAFLCAGLVFPGVAGASPAGRPVVVWSGADSGIAKEAAFRVVSVEEWTRVWNDHASNLERTPCGVERVQRPEIDFGNYMVVAIFGGSRSNTAGLKVVEIRDGEDELVIGFDWLTYQTMEPGDATTPYGFVVLPRSGKPVVLRVDTRNLMQRSENRPPKWREYRRFPAPGE